MSPVTCESLDMEYPSIIQESGRDWLEGDGSFFRSAYYDYRTDSVAIISIIPKEAGFFYCLLWFNNERKVWIQPALPSVIPDTHQKK